MNDLIDKLKDAMPLRRAEAIARDLHFACIHETGHLVVARHLGVSAHLHIECNPVASEARWFSGSHVKFDGKRTRHVGRIIGLAGAIAVLLENWDELLTFDIDDCMSEVECCFFGDGMSETDAALASGYDRRHVRACVGMLRKHWAELRAIADQEEQIAAPKVAEQFTSASPRPAVDPTLRQTARAAV